jgi:23S rRNA (uracil1939-C5)-methyltransferase
MESNRKKKKTPRLASFRIRELSKKGSGLGLAEPPQAAPHWAEVPFTLPGEEVRVQLLRKRSGVYETRLEEILQFSSDRITPKCAHFGSCGGCRLQHMAYENQLAYKTERTLQKFKHQITAETEIAPTAGCTPPWNYRNKMEYSFTSDRFGKKFLGLMFQGSRHAFNLTECHLASPWFVEAVKQTRTWWENSSLEAYHPFKNRGSLRTLTLREGTHTGDRMAILTVSGNPEYALHKNQLAHFVSAIRMAVEPMTPGSQLSIFLRIHQIAKGSPTQFYEMVLYGEDHIREKLHIQAHPERAVNSYQFHVSPSAFFQPNTLQAEKLYSLALQRAQLHKESVVYDLYCGTGTLGICMAQEVKEVIGIEISPESVLDARTNVQWNGCKNVTIFSGAVREVLRTERLATPDLILVDPPRAGLDPDTLQLILQLHPKQIIYVSCNPESQALNSTELIKGGYQLRAIQPVDQFPHTAHVENIIHLSY